MFEVSARLPPTQPQKQYKEPSHQICPSKMNNTWQQAFAEAIVE